MNEGSCSIVKVLCPKDLGLMPVNPASSSNQHAAVAQIPNCCFFHNHNSSTLFFCASPLHPDSSKRDVSICEELSDSVLILGELVPGIPTLKF